MTDDDRSLLDRVKDALGMGKDREHHDEHHHEHGTDDDDAPHRADDGGLGVDGATQATGSEGISGGTGASAAIGGAGAGGAVGATPDPSTEGLADAASGDNVRTEYEMGHEYDPSHETRAESGVLAERAGEAEVDTWRQDEKDRDAE